MSNDTKMSALFPVILNWKLHEESLKKINFKNWEFGKTGKATGKVCYI